MNLLVSLSPIVFLYLNCRILIERFDQMRLKIEKLANGRKFRQSKIDKCLSDYATIIDEVQRCNFFFSKYLAFNYHLAIAICSSLFLCGKHFLLTCLFRL